MTNSRTTYTGDGVTTDYLIVWTYTDTDYVNVEVNGVTMLEGAGWEFSSDGLSIEFDVAPAADATILIYRKTGATDGDRQVVFTDGAFLDEASLDRAQLQTLHVAAENQDIVDSYSTHVEDDTIHVPAGGDAGNFLKKDSGLSGDTSWTEGLLIDIPDLVEGGVPFWPAGATQETPLEVAVPSQDGQFLKAVLNGGTGKYEVQWASAGAGTGNVTGPASSTADELCLFNGASGELIKGTGGDITYDGTELTLDGDFTMTTGSNFELGGNLTLTTSGISAAGTISSSLNLSASGNINLAGASSKLQSTVGDTVTVADAVVIEGVAAGSTNGLELTGANSNFECTGNVVCGNAISATAGLILSGGNASVQNGNLNVSGSDKKVNVSDGQIEQSYASGVEGTDHALKFGVGGTQASLFYGTSSPNGAYSQPAGSLFLQVNGASSNLWINTSTGTGTTWQALL